jgi:ATP/maltotriose-dependent transcriptional regulator MalT
LTLTPEEQACLHQRAADWFAAQDVGLEAIHHALTAAKITNDYQQVVSLVQTHLERYLDEGRLTTVLGWLDRLPESELHTYPDFSIYKAWILIALGEPRRCGGYIAAAEKSWDILDSASRGRLRLAQCFLALAQDDLVLALQFAQESAGLLLDDSQSKWRVIALWALAEAQECSSHITEAIASMRKAVNIGRGADSPVFTSLIELSLATALNINGQRREAVSVC